MVKWVSELCLYQKITTSVGFLWGNLRKDTIASRNNLLSCILRLLGAHWILIRSDYFATNLAKYFHTFTGKQNDTLITMINISSSHLRYQWRGKSFQSYTKQVYKIKSIKKSSFFPAYWISSYLMTLSKILFISICTAVQVLQRQSYKQGLEQVVTMISTNWTP